MQHMEDIGVAYRELLDKSLGRTRVRVETAAALDAGQRDQLVHVVETMEGASVVADFAVNPDLLGGFRLQVGSRVFDGSLAGELGRLSREIEIEQG
jgi:F-type H+-transporting ATPase subunit delta